ncbi:MAG: DUF1343 domain-containing protein [Ekhidna sp.]|nr:DUF1343 domain-containing protein [Ekhidna sp.]
MQKTFIFIIVVLSACSNSAQQKNQPVSPGACQIKDYFPLIEGRKVSLCVNHSSIIGKTHLSDTLISLGVNIVKVFTPEHGFKGTISDGAAVEYQENQESFKLLSLYGKNKKPTPGQMEGIDIMIFDIQDVGTRFYTYISTMHYVMEACAENEVPLIILDRPNPNGSYIDGPVLDTAYRSFVGMHPIPIVHGLTVGELAQMINGEGWLNNGIQCDLTVIPVKHWDHAKTYSLPVRPSPNLPNDLSISLYPSLCLFEGTIMSVGRGTDYPFQQIGHPDYPDNSHTFTPKSREGAKWPPYENEKCFGISRIDEKPKYQLSLALIIDTYQKMRAYPFFNSYFEKLAGNNQLRKQIENEMTEAEIRNSWKKELAAYKKKRVKYLLYD